MSALGQKQTLAYVGVMSALPPKADIAYLFDHLVGASKEACWNGKPETFRRSLVDNQFVPSRALNCQIGWLGTMQYFVDVDGTLSKHVDGWMSVGQ